jgi:penicillin-binding protein 2
VALQDGAIDPNTTFFCPGYYMAGNHKVKCEHVDGTINMQRGIARSCNTYFCHVFQSIITKNGMKNQRQTYANWHEQIAKWGFGQKLGIDMPFEKKGIFYQGDHYDKIYGKRWGYTTVISQAIGQGEITSTPLQMANVMAAIANRGYYLKPHLIKGIGDKNVVKKEYVVKNYVGVDTKYFPIVIDGMRDAVNSPWGTAKESQIPNIVMCGKTGTVQNPHGKNHSVFIGFAPMDNPKIAIAVIVENGGFGGSYAAPISSFMVEKYLTDSIKPRSNGYTVKAFSETNLLPALIDKTKKLKLSKTDSLNIKKADSVKRVKDSLKMKPAILKQSVATKPKVGKTFVTNNPVNNK